MKIIYLDKNNIKQEKSFNNDLLGTLERIEFIKTNFHTKDRKNCNNSCTGCGDYKLIETK